MISVTQKHITNAHRSATTQPKDSVAASNSTCAGAGVSEASTTCATFSAKQRVAIWDTLRYDLRIGASAEQWHDGMRFLARHGLTLGEAQQMMGVA